MAGEKGGVLGGLDFDQGASLPCRPPSNPQPSWRAVAHHLIRLRDLRVVPSALNEPRFPIFSRRNGKRDLAHPENREIAAVLERGAGLITARTAADHRRGLGHDPLLGLVRAAADRITRASKTTAKNRTGTIYTSTKINARRPRHGWTARRVDRGDRGAVTHNERSKTRAKSARVDAHANENKVPTSHRHRRSIDRTRAS